MPHFIMQQTIPMINITIGTPPQALQVAVDIERGIAWVLVSNTPKNAQSGIITSKYNCSDDDYCTLMGYFDPAKSSTLKSIRDPDSDVVNTDVVTVSGQIVDSVPMSLYGLSPGYCECFQNW
jgi:hypothetical protein